MTGEVETMQTKETKGKKKCVVTDEVETIPTIETIEKKKNCVMYEDDRRNGNIIQYR